MAELTSFSFAPGNSRLHRLDVRFKIFCMICLSLAAVRTAPWGLPGIAFLVLGAMACVRLSPGAVLRDIRFFLFFLSGLVLLRALSTSGPVIFGWKGVGLSFQGLQEGGLLAVRLLLIVLLGLVFVRTSRAWEIRAAVEWILRPVPRVPETRISTMLSLMVRFVPEIFVAAGEVSEAQQARGIQNRRNPVYRMTCWAVPLLHRIFRISDEMALAMAARCYTEDRVPVDFHPRPADWVLLGGILAFSGALIWLG